ncbi:hypothetical protein F5888DRAFT_1635742 [Russula emetica]|nr:hypothetical protein F5888DRAFT_1635742 [Russula emetica]
MSNNTPPPLPIPQLQRMLEGLSIHITSAYQNQPARKSLANLLTKFVNDVITPIVPHEQLHPSCNTPIQPSSDSEELKNIQNTLPALTKPANPSLVITLSHLASNADFTRPRLVEICTTLNNALSASPHNQTHVSAVRWTAKGNLVVIGGHMTTAQQLQIASPLITKAFTDAFSTTVTPFTPPHTRANVKWSKIPINGLPTGVTDSRGAFTPDECHTALASENPSYSPLIIAQKPSWVKPPQSFTAGSSSSLVMAFEDPDESKARALLGAKHLYAFGTRATLRKWKQRPTHPTPSPPQTSEDSDNNDDTEIAVAPSQLPPTFTPSGPSTSSTPAAPKPMATRRSKARNKN